MKKNAKAIALIGFFLSVLTTVAVADYWKGTTRVLDNTNSNGDFNLQVNKGGTPTTAISISGTTGQVTGLGLPPTGAIIAFGGSSAPTGWLLADGTAVSRSTYAALFAVLGTAYGAGNGTTTFNLPNMKSNYGIGLDSGSSSNSTLGQTGGTASSAHTHGVTSAVSVASNATYAQAPHSHDMSHVHNWAYDDLSNGAFGENDLPTAFSSTSLSTANVAITDAVGNVTGSIGHFWLGIAPSKLYTANAIGPTGAAKNNTGVATPAISMSTGVILANTPVTSGPASATENRGPFLVVNYIVKY